MAAPSDVERPSGRTAGMLAVTIGAASLVAYLALFPPLRAAAGRLEPLLVALAVVLSWTGLGLPAARRLAADPVERAVVGLAIGMGLTGLATLLLGVAGWLHPAPFVALLCAGWLLLLLASRGLRGAYRDDAVGGRADPFAAWSGAVLLLFFAVLLPFVASPEASTDALGYHLLIPRIFLEHGRIERLPLFVESDYPCLAEYLYLPVLLLFDDEIVCKGVHFLSGVAALLAASVLSRKLSPGTSPLLAPALFLSLPVVAIHMGWAWNDLMFVLFMLLAFSSLADFDAVRRPLPAAVAGAMVGLASWTKYTFLLYLMPLGALALIGLLRRGWRPAHLAAALAGFLGVAATWIVENWALTGNPVYPFVNGIFRSPYWTATNALIFQEANTSWEMPAFTWLHYLLFPLSLPLLHPLVENQTGIVPILVLPLLARRLAREPGNVLRLLALLTAITWVVMFRTKSRSLLALLGLVMALAAAAIHESPALAGGLRRLLLGLLTAAAVVNLAATMLVTHELSSPLGYFFGLEGRERYLARNAVAQGAYAYLNGRRDVGRVAVVGIHEPYYLQKPYAFSSYSDTPVAEILARSGTTPLLVARSMRERGFTHVLMMLGTFDDPHRAHQYSWSPEERRRFEELLREHCDVVHQEGRVAVYRLHQPSGPALPGAAP